MRDRIRFVTYIILAFFGLFILRLWHLQVISGSEYKKIDKQNRLRVIDIPAPRGIIYDRQNRPLVKNVPSFDISIVREEVPREDDKISALGSLLGLKPDDIVRSLSAASRNPFEPIKLREDVTFREVAKVEAEKIDYPGLHVEVVGSRQYIYGEAASHVMGYLGRLRREQLGAPEYKDLPRETFIGQFGVEKIYDSTLRGVAGKKIIEVNAVGNVIKVVRIQRPIQGEDVVLTIDIDLQIEAEKSLAGKSGAIVAIEPRTGELLALASAPSFDPNLFVRGIDYPSWRKLVRDPEKPLLNRAIHSQYPPGSTFKIVSALAALEQEAITKDTSYYCDGSIRLGRIFNCWKETGHGPTSLYKAIVESCDVYFYEVGKRIDIDTLSRYATMLGLGKPTGIPLEGEVGGVVPSREWKMAKKGEQWFAGETLNAVIGQGYLTATPLQMAMLTAAVVNGGRLHEPRLLRGTGEKERVRASVKLAPEHVRLVKEALLGVVADKEGTGKLSRSEEIVIGGKTGTSQVIGGQLSDKDVPRRHRDHAWFVAFAPAENPEIALAVFVEHGGHGSTGAAPIAKKIIETYYRQDS